MTPADIRKLADQLKRGRDMDDRRKSMVTTDPVIEDALRALADVMEQAKESAKHWGCTEELAEVITRVEALKP